MKATIKKISDGQISFYLVELNGREIGMLRKGKNDRYTVCPWQPMTMAGEMLEDPKSPSGYMACYGANERAGADAKAEAIAALVALA
jgi:hypothetical protein